MEAIRKRMNTLRVEADESNRKLDDLSFRVKTLEQENLAKEQEITSLQHKNGVVEQEVEKLERLHREAKAAVEEGAAHGTQNEGLTRKLHLLEEEAEENAKNLKETNENYVLCTFIAKGGPGETVGRLVTGCSQLGTSLFLHY